MVKKDSTQAVAAEMDEKLKALEAARLQIEKQFGQGSIMKLGSHDTSKGIDCVPSGSILLDEALGVGGYPRGRVIEIYGPESSGKTTLALHAIAEAQKLGGIAAFIDAEHALDPVYAKNLGVNIDELWVSQPDSGEQALDITESLVRSGAVDIIVIDSVAALTPQAEIEGDMGDAHMGLQARLMSQALRKLTGTLSKSKTILIFINQIRMKIGVMFGNPETTTGGNALKFYASVRLEVRKIETIEKGEEEAVGNKVRVKVVKNKVAPPFRKVELEIMFGKGISWAGSLIDAAVKYDVIDKKGAWYTWGEEKVGQGRDNAKLYIEQNPEAAATIEKRIRELIFIAQHPEPTPIEAKGDAARATEAAARASKAAAADKVAEILAPTRGPGRPPKDASAKEAAAKEAAAKEAAAKEAATKQSAAKPSSAHTAPSEEEGLF
jgi:recombination protein RecA